MHTRTWYCAACLRSPSQHHAGRHALPGEGKRRREHNRPEDLDMYRMLVLLVVTPAQLPPRRAAVGPCSVIGVPLSPSLTGMMMSLAVPHYTTPWTVLCTFRSFLPHVHPLVEERVHPALQK